MNLLRAVGVKKIVSWAGMALMLVSLLFIARRLILTWHGVDLSILTSPRIIIALLLIALMIGISIILASINFRILIANISGIRVERALAAKVYASSNLYKYIPGGVMYVLGRNRMAIETEGLSHGKVVLSTALEGIILAVAALIFSMAFAFNYFRYYIRQFNILPPVSLVLGLIALIIISVLFLFRRQLRTSLSQLKNNTKDFRLAVLAKRLAFAFALVSLWSGIFLLTSMLMGQHMPTLRLGVTIMGTYILAWLAGMLIPGVPGGLGIREAALLMLMPGMLCEHILLSAIVMHRVLSVVGDVAAYGMAVIYSRICSGAK